MLSSELKNKIEQELKNKFSSHIKIIDISSLSGGCINECFKLKTNAGNFFLKKNDATLFPEMFETEAKGLQFIKSTNAICVPKVISVGEDTDENFLLLEFVESEKKQKDFFEDFGRRLSNLHKNSAENFGLDYNNYIGSLKQSNKKHSNWIDFFVEERLEKQIELAVNSAKMDAPLIRQFKNLYKQLNEIFPEEKPALIHGDLWSGNYLTTSDGFACIIDPAVYYGFREMDISMSKLFGGFSPEFYNSYNSEFPMEKGWENRVDICNLYPLLVHVNLFDGGYLQEVKFILKKF